MLQRCAEMATDMAPIASYMLCKSQVRADSHSLIHEMDNLEIVNIRATAHKLNKIVQKCEMHACGQTNSVRHLSYAANLGFYKPVNKISTNVEQL